ncbi:hypothetical protein GCM10010353_71080 [Streptomyces chryseus]|nr:hypothetical protein GCM10010353_71080 [Streptomyces chryseus]
MVRLSLAVASVAFPTGLAWTVLAWDSPLLSGSASSAALLLITGAVAIVAASPGAP